MKKGDLIMTQSGMRGLIVSEELVYPGRKRSPVRSFDIMWLSESRENMGNLTDPIGRVSPFSVEEVIVYGGEE